MPDDGPAGSDEVARFATDSPGWGFLPNPPKRYIPEMIRWYELRSDRERAAPECSYVTEISNVYSS